MDYSNLPNDLRKVLPRAEALYGLVTGPMNLEHNKVELGDAVITIGPIFGWEPVVSKFMGYCTEREGEKYFETPFRIILKKPIDPIRVRESIVIETPKNCRPWNGLMPTLANTVMVGMYNVKDTLLRMRDYDAYYSIIAEVFDGLNN